MNEHTVIVPIVLLRFKLSNNVAHSLTHTSQALHQIGIYLQTTT